MMKLNETVDALNSTDYKERFKAEYNQLAIRYYGLRGMLDKWMPVHCRLSRHAREVLTICS